MDEERNCGRLGMTASELGRVTPWEIRLLVAASEGLTYPEIAARHVRSRRSVERSFEHLRDKLRPWGGGSKAGLVHWIDVYHASWTELPPSDGAEEPGPGAVTGDGPAMPGVRTPPS